MNIAVPSVSKNSRNGSGSPTPMVRNPAHSAEPCLRESCRIRPLSSRAAAGMSVTTAIARMSMRKVRHRSKPQMLRLILGKRPLRMGKIAVRPPVARPMQNRLRQAHQPQRPHPPSQQMSSPERCPLSWRNKQSMTSKRQLSSEASRRRLRFVGVYSRGLCASKFPTRLRQA